MNSVQDFGDATMASLVGAMAMVPAAVAADLPRQWRQAAAEAKPKVEQAARNAELQVEQGAATAPTMRRV